jgi:hypothetical protein
MRLIKLLLCLNEELHVIQDQKSRLASKGDLTQTHSCEDFEKTDINETWDDSAARDAEGRWAKYRDGKIGVTAMAKWLYYSRVHKSTKADKLKSAYGAIAQQQNTSKLISAAKADALRAELKKLYPVKS